MGIFIALLLVEHKYIGNHYSCGPRAARCPARCCALSSGKLTRAPVGLLASPTGKTQ